MLFRNLIVAFSIVCLLLVQTGCTRKKLEGKTLNIAIGSKIKGMDPAFASDLYSGTEIARVYEPLFHYHYLKRPYEIEPLLATELPSVSDDGLTYTIKVRSGVLFHDDEAFKDGKGREVTAEDFIYSWKRIADPRVRSEGWWIFKNRIVGLDEWREQMSKLETTDYNAPVEGLQALDKNTIQIKLKEKYPQLVNILAMQYTAVVAKEVVNHYGKEFLNHAVGTGAYMQTEFRPSEKLVYKRNPNFRGMKYPSEGTEVDKKRGLLKYAGKDLPMIENINVRIIIESQPRWLHFVRGETEYVVPDKDNFDKAIDVSNRGVTEEFKNKGIELLITPGLDFTYNAFNLESGVVPQFKDIRVRRAIALAYSTEMDTLVNSFFNGMAMSAQTPVPPGISGYDKNYVNPYKRKDALEEAKKLLAEAGYPGGKGFPEIPYDAPPSTTSKQISQLLEKAINKIGLKMKITQYQWPTFQTRIQRRQSHMWGIAWGADYPDAENFLQLFYSKNANPGGMNSSYYKDADFDREFERARVMQDSPERTKIYEKLAQKIGEEMPVVLGVHREAVALIHPWLKNLKYIEFPMNRAMYLDIDLDEKAKRLKD